MGNLVSDHTMLNYFDELNALSNAVAKHSNFQRRIEKVSFPHKPFVLSVFMCQKTFFIFLHSKTFKRLVIILVIIHKTSKQSVRRYRR